jgi:hypothetical protein
MVSLEGTLDLFALPDVLRLLAGTGTAGVLHLDDGGRAGQVWLDGGRITWAAARPGPRALVGRLRHQAGIDPAALAAALEAGGAGLASALVGAGAATPSALAAALREHAEDELAELVGWHSGSFRFEVGAASPETLDEPAAVADALERAAARQAEVEAAAADLGPEVRLAVPASPPGGAGVRVEAEHWRLLAAAGPGARVAELVAASGLGELGTRVALRAMLDAGLLVEAGQPGPADQGEASLAAALDALDPPRAAGAKADSQAEESGDMVQRLVAGVRGL